MNQDRRHAAAVLLSLAIGILVITLCVPPGPALDSLRLLLVPAAELSALALTSAAGRWSSRRSRNRRTGPPR